MTNEHASTKQLLETLKEVCSGKNLELLREAEIALTASPNSETTRAIEGNLLKMRERLISELALPAKNS